MKYLLINRHAKSPWNNLNVSDHDRSLNEKGVSDALEMGQRLVNKDMSFDLMVSSSAIRALTTCQLIASKLKYPLDEIVQDRGIYEADLSCLKKTVRSFEKENSYVAIFGHNPAFHLLAEELSNNGIERFPTCAMMYIAFDVEDWSNCFDSSCKVLFFDYPKNTSK